jgi:hypothetical protein
MRFETDRPDGMCGVACSISTYSPTPLTQGRVTRVDNTARPLALIAMCGADAALYRFELSSRSKAFVRIYHDADRSKVWCVGVVTCL